MLDMEQLQTRLELLNKFLGQLSAGRISCIDYGHPSDNAHGMFTYIRIRYIMTAGGMQFGLKLLSSGVESSGIYVPDRASMFHLAKERMLHYHRPTQFGTRMRSLLGETNLDNELVNTWFVSDGEPNKYHNAAIDRASEFMPGASTITLSL